ncbi:MAG: ABC transporter substrate-binding protein [Proteobacteria bacterium]|nr:ABC transporter substrate-binding protein [Pseudomonadota bacterium]MBU1686934.1 ABC transporter substrate-binding protein [Pseudomonadota bacterium]
MASKMSASRRSSVKKRFPAFYWGSCAALLGFILSIFLLPAPPAWAKNVNIAILMASDVRQNTVDGLKNGLIPHGVEEGLTYTYLVKNAAGDRKKLLELAAEIIAGKPDVAVAGGGIEADALLVASQGTSIPVVFLSVSSAVDRGIIASLQSSGNNFTGIETNDTMLTAKRLWFIKKMLPEVRRVFCYHVPSIVASVQSLALARESAAELGIELQVVEVETEADIKQATASLSRQKTDLILQLPVAPVDKALKTIVFPKALAENIPIFGYGENSIESGAFASYAGSRYANGQQAARLIHKILNGIKPTNIPIETPEKLELIINKNMVMTLDLHLSGRVWRMAEQVVDLEIKP